MLFLFLVAATAEPPFVVVNQGALSRRYAEAAPAILEACERVAGGEKRRVLDGGVPFLVRRTGKDVLVSPNNTQNVFALTGINARAHALHILVWGYSRSREPARLRITIFDGTVQDASIPLGEWTEGETPAAFDFKNTVSHFKHAAIQHHFVTIAHPHKNIANVETLSGTYGLVALTLQMGP